MLVQLLYFPDCPNVDAARTTLAQALRYFLPADPSRVVSAFATRTKTQVELITPLKGD